ESCLPAKRFIMKEIRHVRGNLPTTVIEIATKFRQRSPIISRNAVIILGRNIFCIYLTRDRLNIAFHLLMRYFQNHICRFFTLIIALQVLNMSIDATSAQMATDSKTPDNFNYIDTYVEYVAEIILKYTNAIPESKDRQQKELQQHKQFEIAFQKIIPINISFCEIVIEKYYPAISDRYAYQFIKEINPPPPAG
ncbi:MAG: hypothetical protein ABI416_14955, partial [Ginsengibacter sp.]